MDFNLLWFIPISPPVMAFNLQMIVISVIIGGDLRIIDMIAKGPSFCHVLRIRQLSQDREDITDGNQKWHGAIPIFKIRAIRISR